MIHEDKWMIRFLYGSVILVMLLASFGENWFLDERPDYSKIQSAQQQKRETFQQARIILSRNPEDQSARDFILRK